ncbi:CopG family transcriptional regulator [uncultured Rhodoblastus sp.]|uniref:CopG family transcriptional regulator n=1 Tax=uncultured Rhodoblastus sp. TaxID=543037 RepID=UPI0025DF0CBB|nr:CopG family transcriptional regulator [uncultured Rhodoblastus sp.]
MRTTLAIDDDVLAAARALAAQRNRSLGEIISELARNSLRESKGIESGGERNGIPLLSPGAKKALVTLEIVNALRDEAS